MSVKIFNLKGLTLNIKYRCRQQPTRAGNNAEALQTHDAAWRSSFRRPAAREVWALFHVVVGCAAAATTQELLKKLIKLEEECPPAGNSSLWLSTRVCLYDTALP